MYIYIYLLIYKYIYIYICIDRCRYMYMYISIYTYVHLSDDIPIMMGILFFTTAISRTHPSASVAWVDIRLYP